MLLGFTYKRGYHTLESRTLTNRQKSALRKLQELCAMHPNDPIFHTKLAHQFMEAGHEIRAIMQARRAYQLLIQMNPSEAKELIKTFGDDVASSPTKPFVGADYSPLAKHFGMVKKKMRTLHLKEGAVLFRKGDPADYIYLVLKGELAVSNDNHGHLSLLNHLHQGSILGEGAMNPGAVRNATVVAVENTSLLRMTKDELQQAFQNNIELHMLFSKESMLRQKVANLSASPVFSSLSTDLRFMLAKRSWNATHTAGSTIKPANKYMSHVELIYNGAIQLYEEDNYCGRMGEGTLLGLHRIMGGKTSKLRYIAEQECQVICMYFVVIEDLMGVSSHFRERIRDTAAAFSAQTARTMSLQED